VLLLGGTISTPASRLAEITFRSPGAAPPMFSGPIPVARTPAPPLPIATSPSASTPMWLPRMETDPPVLMVAALMPCRPNRPMASERTTDGPAPLVNCSPSAKSPASTPSRNTTGLPVNPGCVRPSIVVGPVTLGSADSGRIVCTSPAVGGRLNLISSAPASVLASVIACRSEPAPASAVVVTVNVASSKRPSRDSGEAG
jgi:hypothetical protein